MKNFVFRIKLWLGTSYINGVAKLCYTSIEELSIYNWWQVHKTGDYSFIRKEKKIVAREQRALKILWRRLYDQYLKEVYLREGGLGETHRAIIKKNRKITVLYLEMSNKGKGVNRTFIDILENEVKELYKELGAKQEAGFYEVKSQMETELGFAIDIKRVSVKEFYSYVEMIKKNNQIKQDHADRQ